MFEDASVIMISDDGWTETERELIAERAISLRSFHKTCWKRASFFHRNGRRYEVVSADPLKPLPPLSKVLAATFHNPQIVVRYQYREAGAYSLNDLKLALSEVVYRDPDMLTQYHAADELMMRLGGSSTFDDLVGVLHYAATEGDA
jgi:hypothetical protein